MYYIVENNRCCVEKTIYELTKEDFKSRLYPVPSIPYLNPIVALASVRSGAKIKHIVRPAFIWNTRTFCNKKLPTYLPSEGVQKSAHLGGKDMCFDCIKTFLNDIVGEYQ